MAVSTYPFIIEASAIKSVLETDVSFFDFLRPTLTEFAENTQ